MINSRKDERLKSRICARIKLLSLPYKVVCEKNKKLLEEIIDQNQGYNITHYFEELIDK